ncbi:hypothetical protein BGZ58_008634 [Dissophora ornata]|nr:hypothetical protein BGZ58_008634 [Dissophora ornata]
MVSPMMVGNLSAPSSPSYSVVKTEEGLHHNLEYLIYPPFEMQSPSTPQQQQAHHIIPSQRHSLSSPQQRMLSYGEVPFMHQRQHSQHQHQQQIRIQQQQQQRAIEQHQQQQYQQYHSQQTHHQLMYDPSSTTPSSTNQGRSSISSAIAMSMPLSVSIPVTSGSSTLMINSSPSLSTTNNNPANIFTSSSGGAATPMPFFNPPSSAPLSAAAALSKDEASANKMTTAAMMASFQHRGVHPQAPAVSPKRQRSNSGHQHRLALAQLSSPTSIESLSELQFQSSSPHNTIAAAAAGAITTATATSVAGAKRSRRSSGASSSSRSGTTAATGLQAVETDIEARASKVAKTFGVSSAPAAATAAAAAAAEAKPSTRTTAKRTSAKGSSSSSSAVVEHSRTSSSSSASVAHAQPHLPDYTPHHAHAQQVHSATANTTSKTAGAGNNVTHPRRAAQNRAAQRTFRNRRKAYIKDMEQKVLELHQMRARFDDIQVENREIWRRYRVLESLILQNGQTPPAFATTLTPFHETDAGIAAQAQAAAYAAATAAALLQNSSQPAGNLSRLSSEIDGEGEDEAMLNQQQLGHGFHNNRQSGLEQPSEEDHDEDEDDEDGEHMVDLSYASSSSSSSRIDARINIRRPL